MNELTTDEAAAWRAGAEAMREACAKAVMCDCGNTAPFLVKALFEAAREDRWRVCGDAWCGAFVAADLRALPLPEPPRHLLADGLSERGA